MFATILGFDDVEFLLICGLVTCVGALLVGLSVLLSRKPKKEETVTNEAIHNFLIYALSTQDWKVTNDRSLQCLSPRYMAVSIHKASKNSKPNDVYFFIGSEIVNDRIAKKDLDVLKNMAEFFVKKHLTEDVSLKKVMEIIDATTK